MRSPACTRSSPSGPALCGIEREYSFSEIAQLTRSGPAKLLGLADRGHLREGARADVAIYRDDKNRTAMFARARLVLKDGEVIVEDGEIVNWRSGRTLELVVESDKAMVTRADAYLDARFGTGSTASPCRTRLPRGRRVRGRGMSRMKILQGSKTMRRVRMGD